MRHGRVGVVAAWSLTLLLLSAPVRAQQTSAANPEIDEQALAVLKRMAEFLTQAQRFSVTVDTGFDVVQDSGQKIEFGETRQIVLRRPDRVRIERCCPCLRQSRIVLLRLGDTEIRQVYGVHNYHLMSVRRSVATTPGMEWLTAHKNVERAQTP